ncbi:pyrimidodiazepine synthase-like isoform X2 [Hyposmocoma kahamanoa]|uniref:pyrimidodiazepine synthase-like isoform X2 n=1 Tax=Hyposmocoma kahamanoa TaxID=1477025 RepID=UPI000E6D6D17|nr:pyrimidodiazepine synthase-like isoform X2 [Hyposmocoma kahamanoa]
MSSFRVFTPLTQVLELVLPYRNMGSKALKGIKKINFNTKHLKKGDPLPPFNGKLRVYNMRYCPYAQRTILALNAKQLDYEVVNIDLKNKPEWLTAKSYFAKVPSLEIAENVCIYESLVTVEYLDEVYPRRPLLPKDPLKKAFDKIIIEAIGPVHTLFYKLIMNPESLTEDHMTAFHKALTFVEEQLKSRGTKFLDGAEPGYADYMIWPWFERLLAFKEKDDRATIDGQKYKLLTKYINDMLEDPAVSQYLVPNNILFQVMEGYQPGKTPNYDLLLESE